MASSRKVSKKAKRIQSVRKLDCGRCGVLTTHTLYDAENKVYKCTICGSINKL